MKLSLKDGPFSGDMLVFGGVSFWVLWDWKMLVSVIEMQNYEWDNEFESSF